MSMVTICAPHLCTWIFLPYRLERKYKIPYIRQPDIVTLKLFWDCPN
jgi:hypothetical protein